MFFLMGIFPEEKPLDFTQSTVCPACGKASQMKVSRVSTCLSLFFLPVWRWNREYRVHMRCCGAVYALREEKGRAIERDPQSVTLSPDDLTPLSGPRNATRHCPSCGYICFDPSFSYCPRCGGPLEP